VRLCRYALVEPRTTSAPGLTRCCGGTSSPAMR
jgi:hypothetical protein